MLNCLVLSFGFEAIPPDPVGAELQLAADAAMFDSIDQSLRNIKMLGKSIPDVEIHTQTASNRSVDIYG